MLETSEYLRLLGGLFAIVNPFGVVPVYLGLTRAHAVRERHRVGLVTALSVAAALLVALVLGETLMRFFGIGIPSFRIAGGILVLLVAFSMLQNRPSPDNPEDEADGNHIAVVPLAVPLLGGPGAITTVIVYGQRGAGVLHQVAVAATILIVALMVYAILRIAPVLARLLGRAGMDVLTRIMGLILAAIALEFIAAGLSALFPGLM